mgnify:FL=1
MFHLLWRHAVLKRHGILVVRRLFQRVLVPRGHALVKMRSIMGILEQEPHQTVLDLKRVEKRPVLMVLEVHVELLVPKHTTRARDINQLEEKRVSDEIIHQRYRPHEPRIRPLGAVRVCHVKAGHRGVNDLVQRLGHRTLDLLLIWCGQDAHFGISILWFFISF